MFRITSKLLLLSIVLMVVSCSEEPTETINGLNSLVSIENEAAGDNCAAGGIQISVGQDADNDGVLDESETISESYVCNGTSSGNGLNLLARTSAEEAGSNCENGGTLVEIGTDQNQNETLDDDEVQSAFFVCNGQDGTNGGIDGLTSLIVATPSTTCENEGATIQIGLDENGNGVLDTEEIQSTYNVCNGSDGNDGVNSLIECTIEPEGDNCPNGGIIIEIGLDSNGDGTLDLEEKIGEPKYICNGIDGEDGRSPIVNINTRTSGCANGGVELTFGYDDDGDGTVDEVLQTVQICNGSNGSDGSDGLNTIIETTPDPIACPNGGVEIRIGLDKNRDGDIDETTGVDNELVSTEIICNGSDGTDGTDGREIIMTSASASCGGDGGQTYSFGYDNDGNGTIDDLLTSFTICNGSDGTNGQDGNSDGIFEFYFQEGFDGYNGVIDVSIDGERTSDYGEVLIVDRRGAEANMAGNSLLLFSKIKEVIDGQVSDAYEVVEAILYLKSVPDAKPPSAENWIGIKTLTAGAPLLEDNTADWTTSNGSDNWKSEGAAVTEDGGANGYSDMFRLPDSFDFDGTLPLLLNRNEVSVWMNDERDNKGMVLTMVNPGTIYDINFHSSTASLVSNRPLLYVKVKVGVKGRIESEKDYKERWNAMSYEEKLAPLQRRKSD